MSDEQNTTASSAEDLELTLLKDMAEKMGIPVRSNSTTEWLKTKIAERQKEANEVEAQKAGPVSQPDVRSEKQRLRDEIKAQALALVRCQIYNLNPQKNDLEGEIITVSNKYLGAVSKFIPFGEATDNGYHIPKIIYEDLRDRKFQQVLVKKGRNGQDEVTIRMVPEYNIVVMPALKAEEIAELAMKQAAAERLGA